MGRVGVCMGSQLTYRSEKENHYQFIARLCLRVRVIRRGFRFGYDPKVVGHRVLRYHCRIVHGLPETSEGRMGQRRAGTGETSKCVSASRVIQRHIVTRLVNGNRKAVTDHRQNFRYGEAAMHPGVQYQVRQRDFFKLDPATLESTKYKDKRRSVQGPLFDQTRSNTSRSRVPPLSSRALTMTMVFESGLSSRAET